MKVNLEASEAMERMVFNMEEKAAEEFRRAALARKITQGEYLAKLHAFVGRARMRAALGDQFLAAALAELNLESVTV